MRIKHALFAALTGATLLAAPVQASELTKSDVEQIVRDYLAVSYTHLTLPTKA